MNYSIIIPIHNEESSLLKLISELKFFSKKNEIIIVNDGSTDKSKQILKKCGFIKLLNIKKNSGKGVAIKLGIKSSKFDKIIISDGDLELKTSQLKKLMLLDNNDIKYIIGSRYNVNTESNSIWDFGNILITKIFNYFHYSSIPDALCCAKSFFKSHLKDYSLHSKGFDIDVEITSILINQFSYLENNNTVYLSYNRRKVNEGKKLKIKDGWVILYRILKSSFIYNLKSKGKNRLKSKYPL